MKPLKIYLDTQDFANLSKHNIDATLRPVRDFLIEETGAGRIKVGYSFPLIFELIRNADEKHKADRLNKARFVKLLCGNNAHPYPTDLKSGRTFPNSGMWAPADALSGITPEWLKSKFSAGVQERTEQAEGLNRKLRRRIKSNRGISEIFRSLHVGPLTKEDFPGMPVPEKILKERMFEKYITGDVPAHAVISALKQWTIDPENLFEIWYEYSGLENSIENFILAQFDKFSKRMEDLRRSYRELQDARRDLKRKHRQLRKIAMANPVAAEILPGVKFTEEDFYPDFESLSAEFFGPGRGEIFKHYFSSMIESEVQPKQSDLVDLLHFLYIKDVDLFRCDRGMAHHMGRQSSTFQHKIVASLHDLPQRVSELRTSLHSSQRG